MKAYPIKARVRAEGGVTRVDLMDDIGQDFFGGGIGAAAFTDSLSGLRGPLDVHISSAGGMVDQGLAIYNALAAYPGMVTTYNDGLAASIASVIMQAGKRRVGARASAFMVHDAWGDPGPGDAAAMESMRDALSKNSDIIARAYADRAGGTVEQWRGVMQATKWYDADEALAAGLIDEIAEPGAKPAAPVDLGALAAAAPARIMAALRSMPQADAGPDAGPGAPAGAKCKTCKGGGRLKHPGTGKNGMQCPGCGGSGVYDPDHDGDDDSTAAGDTDHDYVEPDGSPGPKALTEERVRAILREEVARAAAGVFAAEKADDSPWDAGKAMANGAASDDPAKFYAGICAGRKDGDPSKQSSWALPYKYHPGDAPNAAGVRAGLAALGGARGGVEGLANEAEAKKTLQAAMKQVNPEWKPEDSTDTIFSQRLREMRAALPALKGDAV